MATLDNLAREHAPPSVWPVMPMQGRFTVEDIGGNGWLLGLQRSIAPFVAFVSSVDSAAAVRLYARMYPVLQLASRNWVQRPHLNYRVVKVIDHLLATPELVRTLQVQLTEVKGPVPSTRPWVRYEYVDPELERLSAGQKAMLRVGPANEAEAEARRVARRAGGAAARRGGALKVAGAPGGNRPTSSA